MLYFERRLKTMQNKKGLSDVVTTVLIVLLVLAAVAAVWAFINNLIQEGGRAITAEAQCANLKVEPVACTISGTTATATVTAQWTSGTLPAGASISGITTSIVGGNGARTVNGGPAAP